MSAAFYNHLSDEPHVPGAELPPPVELWDYVTSEQREHRSTADPSRPHRYKFTVEADPAEIEPHADPAARGGALGRVARPLRPFKIDRYDPAWDFWITEWHDFGD